VATQMKTSTTKAWTVCQLTTQRNGNKNE